MTDNKKFMDDYSRGMTMLRLSGRAFSTLAAGLGYPIPNPNIPTAQVQLNMDESRIEFHINPEFISDLADSDIAAVIAHETFHVVLNHLGEMQDDVTYPKRQVLVNAQECIINDGLPSNVGFSTMDGTLKGPQLYDQDFANFSTKEGYEFILKKLEEEEQQQAPSNEKSESSSGSGDASQGGGSSEAPQDDSSEKSEKEEDSKPEEKKDDSTEDQSDTNDSNDSDSSESGEDEADGKDSNGASGDEDDDLEHDAGCHGVKVVGDSPNGESVEDVLGKAITKALSGVDMDDLPMDVQEALEDLAESGMNVPMPGFSMHVPKDGFEKTDPYAHLNMNWVELLAIINPKMKQSGRPKFKDSWHAPRRRMLHSYPSVILPTRVRLDDPNEKKGDSIPSFVIALDMSGSIPDRLLGTLAALAQSIPSHLIKAFPITWSDGHRVFDPERPSERVPRGGTTLQTVMDYVRKVEASTKTKPYVLVITDGQYNVPSTWKPEEIKEKWYWMAIQNHDQAHIMRTTGRVTTKDHVFKLNDFI